ncbi:Quinolinate phosphoribosyl transferase [Caldicellulosiruptor saccharolyticus DSM 8903]|uniref:nicotinate phosphoribosyltransferase n=1 Tax=Caldicellulosiruptor saccharolyticus (strain ATCC 43494 / DSM 8903 / Tp8T 6331) TaxID=351627 RepID=A4XMW7_CALS8|nr:nicotinate phosphoribosyltransferase [Caldicellulosiruptor saccharolyticus]ABP68252.1 Quinolinate phosphoribosyl transferase [Caldicellulosiruptor saccharolyticus DSM 8903]
MRINKLEDVEKIKVDTGRLFFSAQHDEIKMGLTTDIYFIKTLEVLRYLKKEDAVVKAEIFARRDGIFCGLPEVLNLLKDIDCKVYSLEEGESFSAKEVVMRIEGKYTEFGIFETPILGILASSSAWATAAHECKQAAGDKPILCFGARHIHPSVAPVMERAAKVGGADGVSCILAAKILGISPSGTIPHAAILIAGATEEVAIAYDKVIPEDSPRIILVDTFKDEAQEALDIARILKERLHGIRLDTPGERGGVTPELVYEVRKRLDLEGFSHVKIFVSGGLYPEKIKALSEAGADAFGVGSYISSAPPIDMTMDIKEVDGKPVAKRGRIPGVTINTRLKRVK